MSISSSDETILLLGDCRVEEAEALAGLLQAKARPVDLGGCASMHAAVAQVLLAFAPPLRGRPEDAFLAEFLAPALTAAATLESPPRRSS